MTTCTTEQREQALAKANAIRSENYRIKKQIGQGDLTVAEALESETVGAMRVVQLLQAQRRVGEGKARHILAAIGASRTLRVRDLTDRQRGLLCQVTEGRI